MSSPMFPRPLKRALARGALPSAALLAAMGSLAACGSGGPKFPPACPKTGILADAADLTTFRGTGTDLTDMVVDGRITGINGKCSAPDPGHLVTTLSVDMELARGPAMQGLAANVSYFVSVSRGDAILDKRTYTIPVTFSRTGGRLRLTGDRVDITLPTPDKVTGADYQVLIGFQLTPAELAFNRRRGPR